MRTTSSRFANFVSQVDPDLGHRPTAGAPAQLSVLERRHPTVIQTLRLLWGYPELNVYFEKIYSGRDPSLNLAPDAMAELMVLAGVHRRICPHGPARPVEEVYGAGRWADPWRPLGPRR